MSAFESRPHYEPLGCGCVSLRLTHKIGKTRKPINIELKKISRSKKSDRFKDFVYCGRSTFTYFQSQHFLQYVMEK